MAVMSKDIILSGNSISEIKIKKNLLQFLLDTKDISVESKKRIVKSIRW